MLAVELRRQGGRLPFPRRARLVLISNNLGDTKSLVTHPATTTHQRLTAAQRAALGIGDGLVRLRWASRIRMIFMRICWRRWLNRQVKINLIHSTRLLFSNFPLWLFTEVKCCAIARGSFQFGRQRPIWPGALDRRSDAMNMYNPHDRREPVWANGAGRARPKPKRPRASSCTGPATSPRASARPISPRSSPAAPARLSRAQPQLSAQLRRRRRLSSPRCPTCRTVPRA